MAGNEEVIESLKLEIGVSIKGQNKLDSFTKKLNDLSATLIGVNEQLREYASTVSSLGNVRVPRITIPTVQADTPVETPVSGIENIAPAVQAASEQMENLANQTERVNPEIQEASDKAKKFAARLRESGIAAKAAAVAAKALKVSLSGITTAIKFVTYPLRSFISHLGRLLKQFLRIAKMRAMRAIIRSITSGLQEGIQNLAHYDEKFHGTMNQLVTYTYYLKNAFATLAKPLIELLVPVLIKIINFIVEMINKINAFIAILRGQETYTAAKIVPREYLEDVGEGAEEATEKLEEEREAADELKKSLLGFDEINKLDDPYKEKKNEKDTKEKTKEAALDYSEMFEERNAEATLGESLTAFAKKLAGLIDKLKVKFKELKEMAKDAFARIKDFVQNLDWDKIKKFGESLWITVKDVVFDWSNLNSEQIAEKVMAAIPTLLGAIIGFALAGPAGAVVGAAIGLSIGLIVDALLFNHDGKLDKEEIAKMITIGSTTLLATILGAALGGPKGAIVGATIGFSLGVLLTKLQFNNDGVLSDYEVAKMVAAAVTAICGGVIGFIAGGAKGALIGASIGASLSITFQAIFEELDPDSNFFRTMKDDFSSLFTPLVSGFSSVGKAISDEISYIRKNWDNDNPIVHIKDDINETLDMIRTSWDEFLGFIDEKLDNLRTTIEGWTANLKTPHISWDLNGYQTSGLLAKILETLNLPTTLPKLNVEWYAKGGFPEDGLFMANHGELVGQFANGRTAVANNEQIEAGIEEAAYRGFMRAMQYGGGQGGNITFVAELNGKTLFEEVIKQNINAAKAYGQSPLVVY